MRNHNQERDIIGSFTDQTTFLVSNVEKMRKHFSSELRYNHRIDQHISCKKHWTGFLLRKIMYRKTKNKMTVQYSQLYFLNLFCTIKVCIICFKLQSSFGDYIYSYAEKSISNLRKEEGAFLNACFWVCTLFIERDIISWQTKILHWT